MKPDFTAQWVRENAQCSDGKAWGQAFAGEEGKSIEQALDGIWRADYLIWFLVRLELLTIQAAYDALYACALARLTFVEPRKIQADIPRHEFEEDYHLRLLGLRNKAGEEAGLCMMAENNFHKGHEFTAVAFLARMAAHLEADDDAEALKDAQCVANNLVAATTGGLRFEGPEARKAHDEVRRAALSRCLPLSADFRP